MAASFASRYMTVVTIRIIYTFIVVEVRLETKMAAFNYCNIFKKPNTPSCSLASVGKGGLLG